MAVNLLQQRIQNRLGVKTLLYDIIWTSPDLLPAAMQNNINVYDIKLHTRPPSYYISRIPALVQVFEDDPDLRITAEIFQAFMFIANGYKSNELFNICAKRCHDPDNWIYIDHDEDYKTSSSKHFPQLPHVFIETINHLVLNYDYTGGLEYLVSIGFPLKLIEVVKENGYMHKATAVKAYLDMVLSKKSGGKKSDEFD